MACRSCGPVRAGPGIALLDATLQFDLTEVPDGLRILIRRSKGDQEGQGQEMAIPPRLSATPGRSGADLAGCSLSPVNLEDLRPARSRVVAIQSVL